MKAAAFEYHAPRTLNEATELLARYGDADVRVLAEWCLVAATLGAEFTALSSRGRRVIQSADWFRGLMTTALKPDELLLQVRFPLLLQGTLFGFQEFSRRAGDFALAMALVTFRVE